MINDEGKTYCPERVRMDMEIKDIPELNKLTDEDDAFERYSTAAEIKEMIDKAFRPEGGEFGI